MMQIDIPILSKRTNGDLEVITKELRNSKNGKKVYIETYGCQMNVNDSEIVAGILQSSGYGITDMIEKSDVILLNTCSVRDNAEAKIEKRLQHLRHYRKKNSKLVVGILGCMAERLRGKLIGKQDLVSIVVGPDEYRRVPEMIDSALGGEQGIAVKLSRVETYDDIIPLRTEGISAWLSIMRGCDKFCTYCVVPYTRGRERSKPFSAVINEITELYEQGFKEVTLLGQNVNSYIDMDSKVDFARLLEECAKAVPEMRIRYTTSHPYDMTDDLIETMAKYKNICNYIHLPVQSGSDKILQLMNRHYSIEHYIDRMNKIKELIPNVALSTDIISGFPTETEDDHKKTLELMEIVRYDGAYMFNYSPRPKTKSYMMDDDVPEDVKKRRLSEIIELQNNIARDINLNEHGKIHEVLVEGPSKKNPKEWQGRSDTNKVVIFDNSAGEIKTADLVNCKIYKSSSATLFGELV
ncbi:MAG: tRNA (N6-isopentenyl adenosine(37)-C2)-methylthiotransferase MiaB [Candidatus Kapabacteria bacterium]|nr:tRNA (N6-isopentenyl adenosine(37)-C2)-methylthiotransferase MiaB [Ignavibacteriota bacterium]MCW5884991.1 tRNA (N6-isopentenyl adenosine(37)-C2)-methylthiotransferase MiaB [Candidatus Kapabacteria bacterium]